MSFYRPPYLWALVALVIPVAIHFLFRGRVTVLAFSTARFFSQTVVRASRLRTLQRVALLVTRLLILGLLVLIFAQPHDARSPFARMDDPGASIFVWVDPTMSMDYLVNGIPLWKRADRLIDTMAAHLPSSTRVFVYDQEEGAFARRSLVPEAQGPRHGPAPLENALTDVGSRHDRTVAVVMSDFQVGSPGISGEATGAVERFVNKSGADCPVVCVALGPRDPWNYGIVKAEVAQENASLLLVGARAQHRGLENGTLSAVIGGMRVGQRAVAIRPNERASLLVELAGTRDRDEAGSAQLFPSDPFPHDNIRWFARSARRAVSVLIVGDPAPCIPLVAAFSALGANAWKPVRFRESRNVTAEEIDSAGLIVLNAIAEPSQTLIQLVNGQAFPNKAVIFAPSTDPLHPSMNEAVFSALKQPTGLRLVAAHPRGRRPLLPDTLSPLWRGFPRLADTTVAVRAYFPGIRGDETIALLDNNDALASVVERLEARSRWILLSTELGAGEANNLCESGFFVPFIDRVSSFAVAAVFPTARAWSAGVPAPNPCRSSGSFATVYDAEHRLVGRWERQPLVAFATPGIYQVKPDDAPSYWIAANLDSSECNFQYLPPSARISGSGSIKVLDEAAAAEFFRRRGSSGIARLLWALVLVAVIAEMLLWGGRRSRDSMVRPVR